MIPTIEDIFHMLSRVEISFDTAEAYVREHLKMGCDSENIKDLRDHIAGLAMQAQLNNPGINKLIASGDVTIANVCESSYEWADAMLKERAK